jgi:glycosyltransferase involved in cell wall biosynthesis
VRVAAVSESTAADLRTVGVRSPVVVPQGGIGPQRMFEKEPVPTLLFVGRLARNKRPDHAIEAFRRVAEVLPEARLWIIGEGPMREELARHLPPGAHLIGRVSRNELRERMSKAHVLLATSVREGWGLVVTEANAMGTPAVAYDIPGLKDSVKNGVTGLLVDTNPAAIAAPVIRLLRDSNAYKEMVRNARQWGARCTWDATAGFLMELLEIEANSGESQPSNAMPTPPS